MTREQSVRTQELAGEEFAEALSGKATCQCAACEARRKARRKERNGHCFDCRCDDCMGVPKQPAMAHLGAQLPMALPADHVPWSMHPANPLAQRVIC